MPRTCTPVNFAYVTKKKRKKKLGTKLERRVKQSLSPRIRLALTLAQVFSLLQGVSHARLTSAHESSPLHFLTAVLSFCTQPTRTYHAILINTTRSPRNESHGDGRAKFGERAKNESHGHTLRACGGIVREGVGDNVTGLRKRGSSHVWRQKRSEASIRGGEGRLIDKKTTVRDATSTFRCFEENNM